MQKYTVHLYPQTALHVSGGISNHHQQLISLYLQYLALMRPYCYLSWTWLDGNWPVPIHANVTGWELTSFHSRESDWMGTDQFPLTRKWPDGNWPVPIHANVTGCELTSSHSRERDWMGTDQFLFTWTWLDGNWPVPIQSLSRQVAVTVSLMPDTVDTVMWAPDDVWRFHPKHVEQFADINELYIVPSCCIIIATYYTMLGPLNIKLQYYCNNYFIMRVPTTTKIEIFWYDLYVPMNFKSDDDRARYP